MAFPTSSVLSTFTQADGVVPVADWQTAFLDSAILVAGNAAAPNASFGGGLWIQAPSAKGPDCEVYCDIVVYDNAADNIMLWLRAADGGASGSENGYRLKVDAGVWQMARITLGALTNLTTAGANNKNLAVGDKIGFEAIGTVLTAYHKPSAGAWASWFSYDTVSDATKYTAAGLLGLEVYWAAKVDNFGGGAAGPVVATDDCLPDADIVTTGWATAPLFSKVNDASDATIITATAV